MFPKSNASASDNVRSIVTGDETWIYSYEPEAKQQLFGYSKVNKNQ